MILENQDKTIFTLEHAKIFYQTFAEILVEIHALNIEVTAKVRELEEWRGENGSKRLLGR